MKASPIAALLVVAAGVLASAQAGPEAARQAAPPSAGVLLLAHGGQPAWNENVRAIAAQVDRVRPVEVAFGMATRANIQAAVDRLIARGVPRIVAVPLFVSSHSTVITSTEYLLGLRAEMPPALLRFAKMSHGEGADHAAHPTEDGTRPVRSSVPMTMTRALDAHSIVSAIAAARATAIGREPGREAVILVAHGPVDDESNERWLVNLRAVAAEVQRSTGYRSVDAITVRDDAPAAIRDAATAELQALVQRRSAASRVLVVPILLSYGGIEAGIRTRLDGLDYTMSAHALAPDDRLAAWVLDMAATPTRR